MLVYRNRKPAVTEAKAWDKPLTEGVAQAKDYAGKMALRWAYATNGQGIYQIDMGDGSHGLFFTIFQAFMSGPPKDGQPSPYFGEPLEPMGDMGVTGDLTPLHPISPTAPMPPRKKVRVKLADGKERTIQHMMMTTFWHPDGTPMSAQQFMELLFGRLPEFFQSEAELRALWSAPDTRAKLLQGLADKDFGQDKLVAMQQLFDVLDYVAYLLPPVTRAERADHARVHINSQFNAKQQAFLDFVLQHYVTEGVEELEQSKLNPLLRLKYHDSITDADLGGQPEEIGKVFSGFKNTSTQRRIEVRDSLTFVNPDRTEVTNLKTQLKAAQVERWNSRLDRFSCFR